MNPARSPNRYAARLIEETLDGNRTGQVRVGNLGLVLGLGTAHGVGGRLPAGEHRAPIRVRLLSCSRLASADLFGQGDDDPREAAEIPSFQGASISNSNRPHELQELGGAEGI